MKLNGKKGITVTSIVVYVVLFFIFTTAATTISFRFNRNLFDDRGKAINITAMNKLEYNLLKSASDSFSVTGTKEESKTTLVFSNSDIYVFDLDNKTIYKNGGILVKFLKEFNIEYLDGIIDIDLTLNKYTNEVFRNIKINEILVN